MAHIALVVDDSAIIRKLVSRSLKEIGLETIEAANGKLGLEALEGRKIAVIISDVNMPVMDGLDFVRGLRELPEHKFTPVIFLTTETEDSKMAIARAAGMTAWVVKPFAPEKIMSVVKRVIPSE